MTKRKGQSITIRLDDELADKLQDVASRHNVARSAVIVSLLAGNLDDWQPGTTGQDRGHNDGTTARHDSGHDDGTALARHNELVAAIETIRHELDEVGGRVARLERHDGTARPGKTGRDVARPGKAQPDKPDPLPRVDGEEQPAPYLYEKYETTDKSWAKIADRYHWEKVILPNGKPKKVGAAHVWVRRDRG